MQRRILLLFPAFLSFFLLSAEPDETRWIREHVQFLTSLNPPRSHESPESLNKAAAYIEGKLREATKEVTIQEFTVNSRRYKNVIGHFSGKSGGKRIIIGAHYDVAGPFPGADDNASGVAVLLETAFILHDAGKFRRHNVDVAFYSLEEPPYFRTDSMGSAYHAKSLADAGTEIEIMIALDGVGYFTDKPDTQKYPVGLMGWSYPDRGNFLAVVGKIRQGDLVKKVHKLLSAESTVPVESITAPSFLPGIDFSDHLHFWKKGFPAVLVTDTAFYRNPHYHTAQDTADKLDYHAMTEVSKALFHLVQKW